MSKFWGKNATKVTREHDPSKVGLRYGCAYVYRVQGKFYAWGDFTHCNREDVQENIRILAEHLKADSRLTWIGKAYDGDTYESTTRFTLAELEAEDRYGEALEALS